MEMRLIAMRMRMMKAMMKSSNVKCLLETEMLFVVCLFDTGFNGLSSFI